MLISAQLRLYNGVMRQFRMDAGLTQRQAADLCGIGYGTWNTCENLRFAMCSWNTIRKIATFIGASTDEVCPPDLKVLSKAIQLERTAQMNGNAILAAEARTRQVCFPVDDAISEIDLKETVQAVLMTLTQPERTAITLRYGLNGGEPQTLKEIGQATHVTRERARQLLHQAMGKLQKPVRAAKFRAVLEDLSAK
jgi:RNA polymerase sigma factor (sigma-70 family)